MERKVFWASIEYEYTQKSIDYGKLLGGYVYVFTKALDVQDALKKILRELKTMNLMNNPEQTMPRFRSKVGHFLVMEDRLCLEDKPSNNG